MRVWLWDNLWRDSIDKRVHWAMLLIPLIGLVGLAAAIYVQSARLEPVFVTRGAIASLSSPDGRGMGNVTLSEGPNGIWINAEVQRLTPGEYAISFSSIGMCFPDFEIVAGHFESLDGNQNLLQLNGQNLGDYPRIYAGADGFAQASFFAADITLEAGVDHSILDIDGSSIRIHEIPVNRSNEEAALGNDVACGVIRRN